MLASLFQFLFAPGKDKFFLSFQVGLGSNVTNGAMQSDLIIVLDEVSDNLAGIGELFSGALENDLHVFFGHRFGYACYRFAFQSPGE